MHLEPVRTGDRVFIGNDAVVPPGAVIPDDVLIGIKSKPPENERIAPGDTWFGSPPIKLPTRQKVDIGALWTYEPSVWRKLGRAVFEALHTSFPDRKSTRLNSSHANISYAVFCLKKKNT